ncbi:MAG: hypothetical protein JJ913_10560 [Rhizobiaceae bacterium]|nr:hypothetical protein [Rhizobiaceae bacterium]
MSENTEKAIEQDNVRRLSAAILEVKSALADREDVVHELRDVQRTRLELLMQEVQDVIEDAPDDESFDFAISSGAQPRFWIDAVAHVSIGRDKRSYRFVRDTRAGRVVLAESGETKPVAEAITRYVAERIVERRRLLESSQAESEQKAAQPQAASTAKALAGSVPEPDRKSEIMSGFALVVIGVIVGAAVTVALLRDRIPELDTLF